MLKSERLQLRLSPDIKLLIEMAAKNERRSVAGQIEHWCMEYYRQRRSQGGGQAGGQGGDQGGGQGGD